MDANDYDVLLNLRKSFNSGRTRSLNWRKNQLKAIIQFTLVEQYNIKEALRSDLGKSEYESDVFELAELRIEAKWALKHLKQWMKNETLDSTLPFCIYEKYNVNEPYGIVLVISPWNYPVYLSLNPIIGAIAAGNCVMLKPSEYSTATSQLLYDLLPQYLDDKCFAVKLCGAQPTSELIQSGLFDYVSFTGSSYVGKLVMEAAAKNLTPVTLECGGKSPCIVLSDCNIMKAAQSICNGKFINAGQTCIAPDYVLVEQTIKDAFINALQYVINEWYPYHEDNNHICDSYGKIINEHHFNRIIEYLNTGKYSAAIFGGKYDREKLVVYPTIVSDQSDDHPLMNEEIFGPILPVKSVSNVKEAIDIINKKPKPLAIYLYTQNKTVTDDVVSWTSSGSVCVNDCIVQISIPNVPFGGVGLSGINKLNWHDSFQTFSNRKAVVKRSDKFDIVNRKFLYPPHTNRKAKIMMDIIECTASTKTIVRIAYISSFIVATAVLISFGFFIGRINK